MKETTYVRFDRSLYAHRERKVSQRFTLTVRNYLVPSEKRFHVADGSEATAVNGSVLTMVDWEQIIIIVRKIERGVAAIIGQNPAKSSIPEDRI